VIPRPLADYLGVGQKQKLQILKYKMKRVGEEEEEEHKEEVEHKW
jgi:hypothetical protein